jgi:hypothetical protein
MGTRDNAGDKEFADGVSGVAQMIMVTLGR